MISSPFHTGAEKTVPHVYSEVTAALLDHLAKLIPIVESLLIQLEALEEQLDFVHEFVFQGELVTSAAKDQISSRLWTKLGGNHQDVWNYDGRLKLLSGIGEYQCKAKAHVTSALHTLHALHHDLDDLLERTFHQDSAGSHIPIEVQIKGIGYGIQRLRSILQSEPEVAFTLEEQRVLY